MNETITEKNYPIQARWLIKSFVGFLVLLAFATIYLLMFYYGEGVTRMFLYNLYGVSAFVLLFFIVTIYNIPTRAAFHYSLEDKFLVVKQGVLSKQERHIPYGVIQNIFVRRNIADVILGLATLKIENAQGAGISVMPQDNQLMGVNMGESKRYDAPDIIGSYSNAVTIPGLDKNDVEPLKLAILQKMKSSPLDDNQSGL